MSMNCKLCGTELVKYDRNKYPEEDVEMYDPEGFRSNYECPSCHSIFGCTKSSLVLIVESVYASQFADTMTIREKTHLWSTAPFRVRTTEHLFELAKMGDEIAIRCVLKRLASAEAMGERYQSAVSTVNNLVEKVEEAEAKGMDFVFWRCEELKIKDVRYWLMMLFWEKKVE